MKSVPPRGSGGVVASESRHPNNYRGLIIEAVNCLNANETHPLPRGGTDFMPKRTTMISRIYFVILLLTFAASASAKEAQLSAADPVLEERVMKLSKELRCLVCQNETLADSRADLAVDLRGQIREQMQAGKTDKEIIEYLTQRYGKFILYNPPIDPTTYLLWFGPFVLLLAGLAVLFRYLKRRRELIIDQPLSADDRLRAETLLKVQPEKETA
jgi:cytochrome c-type biogenesis protein CcmH